MCLKSALPDGMGSIELPPSFAGAHPAHKGLPSSVCVAVACSGYFVGAVSAEMLLLFGRLQERLQSRRFGSCVGLEQEPHSRSKASRLKPLPQMGWRYHCISG